MSEWIIKNLSQEMFTNTEEFFDWAGYSTEQTLGFHLDDNRRTTYEWASRIAGTSIATATSMYSIYNLLKPANLGSQKHLRLQVKNIFVNIVQIMMGLVKSYFGNLNDIQPSVLLAGIPMPSVQEVSHAISDRVLKYRATGGIFLAHQEGGEQTLRLVGKAFGGNRFMFLTMLDFLFNYGSAKMVDLLADAPTVLGLGLPGNIGGELGEVGADQLEPQVDPWAEIEKYNFEAGREEQHLTFPVITQTKVYTNMYIETYDFKESIEDGMELITYSIFLRKYKPEYSKKYGYLVDEMGTTIWYYADDEQDVMTTNLRRIDMKMEVGFTTAMITYRFLQFMEGNSPETNIGFITGINLNQQNDGEDTGTPQIFSNIYTTLDYDLRELSISQREELMQVG